MIARDSIASASSVGFLAGCWLYQGIQWRMLSASDHSFVICLVFPTNRPLRVSRIIILSHWAISHSYRYSYIIQLYVVQNCSPNRGLKTRNWSQIGIPCGNVSELTKIFPTHPHTTISSYSPCQLVDSRNGKSWNVWYILPQTTWTRTTRISWSQRKDESFPRKWVGENATSLLDSIFPQRNGLVRQTYCHTSTAESSMHHTTGDLYCLWLKFLVSLNRPLQFFGTPQILCTFPPSPSGTFLPGTQP